MTSQTFPISAIDEKQLQDLGQKLHIGEIAVIPTDTIYGIVGSALNQRTVEKIYKLRKRTSTKPMIILVDSKEQILDLGVKLTDPQFNMLFSIWPNPISIVVDAPITELQYLHRGKKTLAFRNPKNEYLSNLLKITGPLVAPSANFEGEEPALNINDAKKYFEDSVLFYIDGGELKSKPSTIAKLEGDKLILLREGAIKIPKEFLND